jgi:hypothetical protein
MNVPHLDVNFASIGNQDYLNRIICLDCGEGGPANPLDLMPLTPSSDSRAENDPWRDGRAHGWKIASACLTCHYGITVQGMLVSMGIPPAHDEICRDIEVLGAEDFSVASSNPVHCSDSDK